MLYIVMIYLAVGFTIMLCSLPLVIKESIIRYKAKDPIYPLNKNIFDLVKFVLQTTFAWPLFILVFLTIKNGHF